jgi:hypothetical protein
VAPGSTPPHAVAWHAVTRPGGGGLEDGFDFLHATEETPLDTGGVRLTVGARELGDETAEPARLHVHAPPGATLWRAVGPRAPGHGAGPMCAVRAWGDAGAITTIRDFDRRLARSELMPDGAVRVTRANGDADVHRPPAIGEAGGWRMRRERAGQPVSEVTLAGLAPPLDAAVSQRTPPPPANAPALLVLPRDGAAREFALGRAAYRGTEASWDEAGRPTARVSLALRAGRLEVHVAVWLGRRPRFVPPGTDNPLDNERAGINGDGVQLHLAVAAGDGVDPVGAWLLVPVAPGSAVDVTRTTAPGATAEAVTPAASWAEGVAGWAMDLSLPLAPLRDRAVAAGARPPALVLDVLVNEAPTDRERRRGQLVLGGLTSPAERAYLAGDRHDAARGLRLVLPPG